MKKTLGETIREARVRARMTQKDLAARIKKQDGHSITPQYLNDIEFDRRTPTEYITKQIAKLLDLDADYLVFLAGALPGDILKKGISGEAARQAVKIFRKVK